jgi:hypothetical protein
MLRRRFQLKRLPVILGATILFVPWFFLMWNATVGGLLPRLRFESKHSVVGAQPEELEALSLESVWSGHFQKSASKAVGTLTLVYKPSIRWKSQIYYSLLSTSGSSSIVIGRDGELFDLNYVQEYCGRDTRRLIPQAEEWAAKIAWLQSFYETRGKVFLYVNTPSKPAVYPDYLPAGYKCPAAQTDRLGKLEIYRSILERHHIHYIDAATLTAQTRGRYPIDAFPRGGNHWTVLGASLAAQAITQAVNRQHGSQLLTPFKFSWQISYDPLGWDKDLLDLLNLRWPREHYPVPALTFDSRAPHSPCQPARITEVGGSFLFTINAALQEAACPPVISQWFYWDGRHFLYSQGPSKEILYFPPEPALPVDVERRNRDLLTDLDVMVFEENDERTPASTHGQQLFDFLAAQTRVAESSRSR